MKVEKKFSNKVTYTSFIMSIFVMYIHAINLSYYDFGTNTMTVLHYVIRLLADTLGKLAVPYFFIMSAYWLFRTSEEATDKGNCISRRLVKKVKTLLIPYLCWNTIGMIFYMAITRIPFISSMMNNQEVIEITVESIFKGVFLHTYYYSFWYMSDLIVLTVISPFLLKIFQNKKVSIALISVLFLLSYFDIDIAVFKAESLFYFSLGGFISLYLNDFWSMENKKKTRYVVSFIIFASMRYFDVPVVGRIAYLILPLLMWKSVDVLLPQKLIEQNLSWFVSQTFFIYAAHLIPITCLGHLLSKVNGSVMWATLSYCAAPIITLIFIYIVSVWMHRYIPKLYSILCGARN